MKTRFLFFGLLFALLALPSRAQIYEMYSQNFETGTPVTYTLSSASHAAAQSTIVSGGSRSMKLTHTQSTEVTMILDTIDFSANATFSYYTLEFMHLAYVDALKCNPRTEVCLIDVQRPGQSTWTRLNSTHYNMAEGGSTEFGSLSSFSKQSYSDWNSASSANNSLWKKERFDLDQVFQGVAVADRKLVIKFTLAARIAATSTDAWYIDDIKVCASSMAIVTPTIKMRAFPDMLDYPSSRGAKLVCDVTTSVLQGIDGDSVYCLYRVGNRTQVDTVFLHRQTPTSSRFEGRIPFYGYDTLMHYHICAKDSTVNHNTVYFPKNASQWMTYRCVRGKNATGSTPGTQTNNSSFPFPNKADNRSEFTYDSAMMASLGFGPGYITSLRLILATSPQNVTRPHVQIRMANQSGSTTRTSTQETFTASEMQVVYDGSLTIEQAAAGSTKTINLQDTFFYAGQDILVQVLYDGNVDPLANNIKHVPIATNKYSVFTDMADAGYGYNFFGADIDFVETGYTASTRPWMYFTETKNIPLVYDCGISAFAYPSYNTPCNVGTDSVVVWLKNFGAHPMDSIDIYYSIDNAAPVHHLWTSTTPLLGGDSIRVVLSTTQNFTVGYHTMRAWVADTLRSPGYGRFRDHEPLNDEYQSAFAACDGPYNGVRTVGAAASDNFQSLEECLYVLSRCGINAPLTIKLPAGNYDITKFPYIPGTSVSNYVQFEPKMSGNQYVNVTFRRSRSGEAVNAPVLVDMSEARGVRMHRIKFSNGTFADNRCNTLVQLGANSAHCQFLNCTFVDSNTVVTNAAAALLNTGNSDSVLVQNCVFYGGTLGATVTGVAPDVRSTGNIVRFNDFSNQVNTAIRAVNQDNLWIDSNYVNDVQTNTSYAVLAQYCYGGSRITRNRVYTSKGTCCIGVSDFHGSPSNYAIVANNMLVSADDGTSNLLTTPLNIIKGSYIKVVFNSVRMNAPTRVNIAAATLGGDIIEHCYFQNNVIASFDTSNYAFSFIPGDNESTLQVDHNCYYSISGVINKLSGANYTNMNAWRNAVPGDLGSVFGNPNYTNGSICRVDLRSFNALLRNTGVAVPEVTTDLYGSVRDASNPSMGAYEVVALSIDFKPISFVTPYESYCGAPSSIPVEVAICNTGNGIYSYSGSNGIPIMVYYSIDNGPIQSFTATNLTIGGGDTVTYLSNRTMSLPYGANNSDRTYNIRWWVKCTLDPDDLNDTNTWTVISRYAAPAPTPINVNVNYNTATTITPTGGINTWPVSYYTSGNGRQQRSGISWYDADTNKFYYGPSFTTDTLYDDTTFFISQKRNLPLVKITEVQVNRTAPGATNPMPSYLNSATFAVELTNCGDYPANLEGDSILVVQPTAAAKIWVLPNVTIEPGANLVLQFRTSTTPTDSTRTICAPSTAVVSPSNTTNFGVIYRDGHGVADAVAFNAVISSTSSQPINWNNQGVPAAVWQGNAIDLAKNGNATNTPTAGARRIAWPTNAANASPTATASLWQVATAANPMHISETETNLVRYFDNGCEGAISPVNITIVNRPTCDLFVDQPQVDTGCNLSSTEPIVVTVHNYGASATSDFILYYSLDGGATVACADSINVSLAPLGEITHTFSRTLDLHRPTDTTIHLKVWVNAIAGDAYRNNDTVYKTIVSRYSPEIPSVVKYRTSNYDDTITLAAAGLPATEHVIWYNSALQVLDTTEGTFVTPTIYHPDTFYYNAIALRDVANTQVGTLASATNNNYPSPYNPKTRYVKEQYIYTADQIRAAGHSAGTISSIAFFLNSMGNGLESFTFDYYTIRMGTTTNSTFANTTYLTGVSEVYSANNLTLTSDDLGWVKHTLTTPFVWDGTSNVLIEVSRALSTAGISVGANTRFTTQANTVLTKQNATADQDSQTAAGSRGGNRPDILFGFLEPAGCQSAMDTVFVDVIGIPDHDAGIEWVNTDATFNSCDTSVLSITVNNMGRDTITTMDVRYKIDNDPWQTTTVNVNDLTLGYSRTVDFLYHQFTPGLHSIIAVASLTGDTVLSNDTITRTINVRFCAGEYSIGNCTIDGGSTDFATIGDALNVLHNAGVDGPVVFNLCPQTYNEQLNLGNVTGASATNTITFRTLPGSSDMAKITYNPTVAANYVMDINAANYVIFDSLYFYAGYTSGSGNNIYASVLKVTGSSNITFRNSIFRSKKTTASTTNANVITLGSENHYITINNCLVDSGYYGIRTMQNDHSDNITITKSTITQFWFQGIYLRNCDTVVVTVDSIHAGVTVAGKPLTGIYLANINHASVQRNFIYLIDNATGGKRGIVVSNCRGTNMDRVTVYNNMISLNGTAVASLNSAGIWVDSNSYQVNVFYNTARVYAGLNQANTRAFSVQLSSNVNVMNNIFDNASKGYAAYVAVDSCIASSNYNVFYSNCPINPNNGARKWVHWGVKDHPIMDSLLANTVNRDINSFDERVYYVYTPTDLQLTTAQFSDHAQYNPDVTLDVYGHIRPQIPKPTIGAYEFNHRRVTHDVAVMELRTPYVPEVTTGNNPTVLNIETDSILVTAAFFNSGNARETNITWYAYLADVSPEVRTVTRTIAALDAQDSIIDSVKIASPLGLVDTHGVVVVVSLNGLADQNPADNVDTGYAFIYPAYDLKCVSVAVDSTCNPAHCRMYSVPLRYTIQNVGKKDFPADFEFSLGYDYYLYQPTSTTLPNFPGYNGSDVRTWGAEGALPVGITREIVLSSPYNPNLYPTGTLLDITAKLRGFVNHIYDVKPLNDTTNYINITSNHTPEAPVGSDTMVNFGSYGNLWATQGENRVIRWGRDTVSGNFFYNGNNNYNRSTHWSSTPQYFHDSCYYLSCISNKNCTSYYSQICVGVNMPLAHDVSIKEVLSPRASGRVYNERDTVKLRIVNLGSQPATNIPITFQWMNANGRTTYLQITDTLRPSEYTIPGRTSNDENLAPYYDFEFAVDSQLLNIMQYNPSLGSQTYTLNAWLNLPDDLERHNDTLRSVHTFLSLPESKYDYITLNAPSTTDGFDISLVSFNEINNAMPDLIGYDKLWFGNYNESQAEVRTLRIRPGNGTLAGTTDTLTVVVANNMDESDYSTAASLCVAIDYNRDGYYDLNSDENLTRSTLTNTMGVKVRSRQPFKLPYTIPVRDTSHQFGYTRMLVWVDNDSNAYMDPAGLEGSDHNGGQIQQYLIYIAPDKELDSIDGALTRVAGPARNMIADSAYAVSRYSGRTDLYITDTNFAVTVMMANNGSQPITSAIVNYTFANGLHVPQTGVINWSGNLLPGESVPITLDSVHFYEGTTDLTCHLEIEGDTMHDANNWLYHQYHRFYVVTLRYIDSFDEAINKWYTPAGYNNYTRNYWRCGIPAKNVISSAYSQPNAFVTDCNQTIVTGKHGNRSVLYSPIFDIQQIRPDTLTFLLSKNLVENSTLVMEYIDFEGKWQRVDDPGARWGATNNTSWYDEEAGWTGSSPNGAYVSLTLPLSLISGEFGQNVRFRFVYETPVAASASAAFGDGVAIDNFRIGRARRAVDLGVTEIIEPTAPQFGQTLNPKFVITNWGYDPISDFLVGYTYPGKILGQMAVCTRTVEPGDTIHWVHPDPFTITNIFPDTFDVYAYTRVGSDVYNDNDATTRTYGLSPLANDLYLYDIISPGTQAVAGDSLYITLRLRNFGQNEIDECDVYFVFNEGEEVHEHVRFADYLGRNLGSTEFFNYTFRRPVRATMGTMQLQAWTRYRLDTYPYNDTLSREIASISSLVDVAATAGMVDKRDHDETYFAIVLDNVGARLVNGFRVGMWYDNDTSTRFEETFYTEHGLGAGRRAVHMFSQGISRGSAPINYLTVYVAVPGDTIQWNDTATNIAPYFSDISLDFIEVEENRTDSCRLRVALTNHGNITYNNNFSMDLTVNGSNKRATILPQEFLILPGETRRFPIKMDDGSWYKIPKNPNRQYTGQVYFRFVNGDEDATNNQTNRIDVINYFEDIPFVDESQFVLEQNYPNPFEETTDIEFTIPLGGNVRFFVTDAIGRLVYDKSANYEEGRHVISFDRATLNSGVYYYGIDFEGSRRMHKMIIR